MKSFVVSSSSDASADSSLPDAFKRGPNMKPIWPAVVLSIFICATPAREKSPCRLVWRICRSPLRTNERFSPISGARSATVPNATRSSRSESCVCPFLRLDVPFPINASASLYAIPTPARSLSGYVSPCCLGLMTAKAGGRLSPSGW